MKNNLLGVASALLSLAFATSSHAQQAVLQRGNDPGLSGANLAETTLNVSNVNPTSFGLVTTLPVDADVYAQPLYVPNVAVAGQGTHNVLYVASMNDTLYAFDADSGITLWSVNFAISVQATPAPINQFTFSGNQNIVANIGILSTPVIDASTKLLYLVACTLENGTLVWRLHAVDITSGTEPLANVIVSGSYQYGSNPVVQFDGRYQTQRTSLTLAGNQVVFGFGALELEYAGGYSGWVMSYNKQTLAQSGSFATVASGTKGGGVWQSGRPPVVDSAGLVYLFTGNGYTAGYDGASAFSESLLKLDPSTMTLVGSYTPSNWLALDQSDQDLASSGPMLVPNTNSSLITGGGKAGYLYLWNTTMTKNSTAVLLNQKIAQQFRGGPVYWQRSAANGGPLLYHWGPSDVVKAFTFNGSTILTTPAYQGTGTPPVYPGGILAISANGDTPGSGILWATVAPTGNLYNDPTDPGVVYAMDASNVGTVLWSSTMNATRDGLGNFAKFVPPTIANGKVYVATFSNRINVYGLLTTANPTLSPAPGTYTSAQQVTLADTTPGAVIHYTTDGTTPTNSSPVYVTGATLSVSSSEIIQAIAITSGFNNSAVVSGTYTISVPLSTTFTLSPMTLVFGSQTTGTQSSLSSTLQNTGVGTLPISSVAVSSGAVTQFTQTNTCGVSVAGGASCTITVVFKPTSVGGKTAVVAVTSGNVSQAIQVNGSSVAASYTVTPSSLAFGSQSTGVPSAPQSVGISNTGGVGLPINGITLSGAQVGQFSETNNCPSMLGAGAACTVQVTFLPTTNGAKATTLKVATAGGAKEQTVALSGTGTSTVATFTLNPASLAFGNIAKGTSSAALPITLTNTGTTALAITRISNTQVFSQTNNCGTSVAVGTSCTINVTFSPTAKGVRNYALTVTPGKGAAVETVALAGTGI